MKIITFLTILFLNLTVYGQNTFGFKVNLGISRITAKNDYKTGPQKFLLMPSGHGGLFYNYGLNDKQIDYFKEYGSVVEAKRGTTDFFWQTYNYAITQDSSTQQFYQYIDSTWDLKNVMDYFSAETYFNNGDWIGDWTNNIKIWRPTSPVGKFGSIILRIIPCSLT